MMFGDTGWLSSRNQKGFMEELKLKLLTKGWVEFSSMKRQEEGIRIKKHLPKSTPREKEKFKEQVLYSKSVEKKWRKCQNKA